MRSARFFILSCFCCLALAGFARAGEVQVFMSMEEGVSEMELRSKAMAEGFALAVLDEARLMLPGSMDEVRTELFKEYMLGHAKPFIQGYKILSSQSTESGLIFQLDVQVNKRTLREGLKKMGMFDTAVDPLTAVVTWSEDFDEETVTALQGLMTLTGIQAVSEGVPAIILEARPEKTFKGRFATENQEWVVINKDMAVVWFSLWGKYFTRSDATTEQAKGQTITVSGWFSPDAALEFDRVLKTWDSAVQDVQLVELDMQPTGVGGTWEVRLINTDRLDMLLKSYLPQRGLSYQLSKGIKK